MHSASRELTRALQRHRSELARSLLGSFGAWDKFPEASSPDPAVREEFARRELLAFVDYLALYFKKNDPIYLDLYVGEKLKQGHDPRDSSGAAMVRRRQMALQDRESLRASIAPFVRPAALLLLMATLDHIVEIVSGEAVQPVRVLFVGDCIHLDVVSFLARPLLGEGLRLEPSFATSKNPAELHRFLRQLEGERFDIVFFSPFGYEFHVELSQLRSLRSALLPAGRIRALAARAQHDADEVLRLLGGLFEAPIFVHNWCGVRRHDGSLLERLKGLATLRSRRIGRRLVNAWVRTRVLESPTEGEARFFLLDEASLLKKCSGHQLGRLYYNATMQHPAELGRWVADLYLDALVAQAVLRRRKVIVCDLDNTLWNGMIGEGEIQHLPERQKILKALRDRGMLLAINSKNARESVDWEGAVLGPQDFVSTQINWLPKAQNTERIAAELNLNCRDFLFLDDQPAERAMMAQVMPEVLCVDAGSPTVWRRLALLAELLPRAGGVDRTLFYQQRSQRQLALALPEHDPQQQAAVFRKLGLEVRSRAAVKKDAPRLVELINRTNQFNLCGSRTTPAEMHRWLHSANHQVLALEAQDKFGSMGTVCVAVLERTGGCLDIVAFVLSCRVFGFGVETVLINTVKRIARSQRASAAGKSLTVRGRWVETGLNEPCRSVYADHGFALQGGLWSCQGTDPIEDPEWLTVIREPMERYAIG